MSPEINEKDTIENQDLSREYGALVKNSFFSFLNTYGTFIFSLISSFLLARLIGDLSWSYFVLGLSYIQIISLITNFLPPSLRNTLHYYIPRFISLNQKKRLKSFIFRAIYVKALFLIPTFVVSILSFILLSNIFLINLPGENIKLLLLLSPLIIINNLQVILNSVNIGFNRFKTVFYLVSIQYLIYIGFLLYFFVFFDGIDLESLALIFVFSAFIPFILNIIINIRNIHGIKVSGKSSSSLKDDLQDMVKYGGLVRAATFFSDIWGEIQVQSIGIFKPESVLGFKISRDLLSVSVNASLAISYPLTVSFSSFVAKEKKANIVSIYNLLLKYIIFLIEILTGLLFFCTDIFIAFIYGEPRLIYSDIVKLYLFTFVFLIIASPLDSLLLAENKGKYLVLLRFIGLLLRLPLFLVLLVFFDFYIAIVGITISNFVFSAVYLFVTIKIGNIKLNVKKIIYQYLVFFFAIGFTIVLEFLILDALNDAVLQYLGLQMLNMFNIFSLMVFVLIYMLLIIEFRILTVGDIKNLQLFFNKESMMHKMTNKALNFLKKFLKE